MNVLAGLNDAFLAEHFSAETLRRARSYVDAVGDVELSSLSQGSVTATAVVPGTRPEPYQVQLHAEIGGAGTAGPGPTPGGWLLTVCTCPVRSLCKHGAAVALHLRRGFVPAAGARTAPGQDWRTALGRLTDELGARGGRDVVPLALEFTLDRPRSNRASGRSIRLRPMRPGTRQPWVKGGADWADLARSVADGRHPSGQAAPMGTLQAMLQAHRSWYSGQVPALEEFGPSAIRLLREAIEAGVEVLCTPPLHSVVVRAEPVGLIADVTRAARGTAHELRFGIDDGERLRHGEDLIMIGHPARAVGLLSDGELTLADLHTPLPAAARHLVDGGPLTVPAADLTELEDRLPGLVRLLPVRSSDASTEIPEPPRPILVLTVTWHDATRADLLWQWRYGAGRVAQWCALRDRTDLGGLRDREAEAAVLAALPTGSTSRREVRDGDALALALHELPHLQTLADVEIVEQERPRFREATEDPEIRFDLVSPGSGGSGADGDSGDEETAYTDWLDLAVVVRIEGEPVPLPDVLAALTLGRDHLILPSGLYISTDRPELTNLREIVLAAGELRERDGDRIGIGRHDLGIWAQLADTGLVDRQAAEWVHRAQALRDLTDLPRPDTTGVETTLRSYQLDGFQWLAFLWEHGLGGILADDMGLGKTLQVLALISHARSRAPDEGPFLVVAPTSVVTAWVTEAARHTPGLRIGLVTRQGDDVAEIAATHDVVITTYTLLRLAAADYSAQTWGGLILDEAQNVKNHQSKTYGAVRAVSAPFRLAVTGTPFENRLMELWALLSITVPGLYPWPREFQRHVARPVERDGDTDALGRFQRRVRPFLLRRTKEVVADDLPPKQEQELDVVLAPKHRKIYDAHLAKERQRLLGLLEDFDQNRVAIFSALTTLRMLALDPGLVDGQHDGVGSAKTDALLEHLAEITAEGHRALVFSQFTSYLSRVRERLEGAGVVTSYLDGSTRDRAGTIDRFRAGESEVFLISLKAGGVGLTLTEADYVFVLDPWWNPAAEAQAVDRAHRIGQTEHVHVYRMVALDTIEEKVMELKARKAALFAQVIDGDGAVSSALDADDIRGLFRD